MVLAHDVSRFCYVGAEQVVSLLLAHDKVFVLMQSNDLNLLIQALL